MPGQSRQCASALPDLCGAMTQPGPGLSEQAGEQQCAVLTAGADERHWSSGAGQGCTRPAESEQRHGQRAAHTDAEAHGIAGLVSLAEHGRRQSCARGGRGCLREERDGR